jgi:magnesium chelatase family protein
VSLHIPTFSIVGLPLKAARDAKERVLSALYASGLSFPSRRFVLNLYPSRSWAEDDRSFDLPIAIACLVAAGELAPEHVLDAVFLGELSLSGEIKPVRSDMALWSLFKKRAFQKAYIPLNSAQSLPQGALGGGFANLRDLITALRNGSNGTLSKSKELPPDHNKEESLLWDSIQGHATTKRLLEVAAAGEHHAFFMGASGAGKTMIAHTLPSILPPRSEEEAEESRKIYAVRRLTRPETRPFRAPHSSLTVGALLGGGAACLPGEMSLAHTGVLFLDEMLEVRRETLESLRTVLEQGEVRLSRGQSEARLPARFNFVGAANLCPCGTLGNRFGECRCGLERIEAHNEKLSLALLDRIDIRWLFTEERSQKKSPSFDSVKQSVSFARTKMNARQGIPNGRLTGELARKVLPWSSAAIAVLEHQSKAQKSSYRDLNACSRIALTIADLRGGTEVEALDIKEAMTYRKDPREPSRMHRMQIFEARKESKPIASITPLPGF